MPEWVQWVTFIGAVLGAGAGVFNAVVSWQRGRRRWRVAARVYRGKDGALALSVVVVNTGYVAVPIKQVTLHPIRDAEEWSSQLTRADGRPRAPFIVEPGREVAIDPVHTAALQRVGMGKPVAIMAVAEDGAQVKVRCRALRKLYAELERTQAEATAKAGGKPQDKR